MNTEVPSTPSARKALRVVDLKAILAEKGLETDGVKAILLQRLEDSLPAPDEEAAEPAAAAETVTEEQATEKAVEAQATEEAAATVSEGEANGAPNESGEVADNSEDDGFGAFGAAFMKSVQQRLTKKNNSTTQQTREAQAKKWEQDELERSEWAERMLLAKTEKKGEDEESDDESDAEDEADSSDEDDTKEGKDKVEQRSSEVPKNPNLKRSRSSDDEDAPMKPKKKKKPSSNKEKTWRKSLLTRAVERKADLRTKEKKAGKGANYGGLQSGVALTRAQKGKKRSSIQKSKAVRASKGGFMGPLFTKKA